MVRLYLLNRVGRINSRLKPHMKSIERSEDKDIKKEARKKYSQFKNIFKRVRIYLVVLNIAFVLLYASAVSAILGDVFLIGEAASILARIGGVLGATILMIIVTIFTRLIILDSTDAHVISSEIVSLDMLLKYDVRKKKRSS